MNYLAQINISNAIRLTHSIFDRYDWHQKIWTCFPEASVQNRNDVGFLFRVDEMAEKTLVWVLSKTKPTCPNWCPKNQFKLKEISPHFLSHSDYYFDIYANPTQKKVQRDQNGNLIFKENSKGELKRSQGKRIAIKTDAELAEWLNKKGAEGGFEIQTVTVLEKRHHFFKKQGEKIKQKGCLLGVQLKGKLTITDHELFKQTYQAGIGSAKGFGFGLILIAPIQ